jgi:hypothetical protein
MREMDLRERLAGYEAVNRYVIEEARALTFEQKLEQLESLYEAKDLFPWNEELEAKEIRRVRELWMRLHGLPPL